MPAKKVSRRKKKRSTPETPKLSLPTSKSKVLTELGDFSVLIHGEKKIGKTSLASQLDAAFFLMTEAGSKCVSIYERPCTSWAEFLGYLALLKEDTVYKTVVIDTVDNLYKMCLRYVCKKKRIEHPSDEDWGKGWEAVRDEFTSRINQLLAIKGVILISHSQEAEVKTRAGKNYHKIIPTLSGQAADILEGIVDIWCYYGYERSERYLWVSGDDHIGAGNRLKNHFRSRKGKRLSRIPMGNSEEEAFKNFMDAFNNRLVVKKKKGKGRD